jgi:hypothetical protein
MCLFGSNLISEWAGLSFFDMFQNGEAYPVGRAISAS